jgi:nicotinamide-nucleotide amidase
MFNEDLVALVRQLLDSMQKQNLKIVTAESCTGGLLSALITEVPGSSKTLDRTFVTYSNQAKIEMLGVAGDIIADYGAVSEPVAIAMAEGALSRSRADVAVSLTGIAGPGGNTAMKSVGLVHIAVARHEGQLIQRVFNFGDVGRSKVREKSLKAAIDMCLSVIE